MSGPVCRKSHPTSARVTEWLRRSEFGVKLFRPSRRLVRRECEQECGTLANGAFPARGATERRHQVLDDGKTQTGATQLSRAGLIHPVEAFEEARQIFGGNPDSGVADVYLDVPAGRARAHRDPASRGREFDGIVQQVAENLRYGLAVAPCLGAFGPGLFLQPDFALLRDGANLVHGVLQQSVHQVAFEFELLALLFDA